MTQQPSYLRFLEAAKQAELAIQLRLEGYTVETDKQIGNTFFDVVARRGDRAVAYEVRSVGSRRVTKDLLRELQQTAKDAGLKFHLIIVNPPPRVNIEIPRLRSALLDYVMDEGSPELHSTSRNTGIDDIFDVEVSGIRIDESGVHVEGTGTIEVTLQYGGSSASADSEDSYPFEFEALLSSGGALQSMKHLKVDTSSFYE